MLFTQPEHSVRSHDLSTNAFERSRCPGRYSLSGRDVFSFSRQSTCRSVWIARSESHSSHCMRSFIWKTGKFFPDPFMYSRHLRESNPWLRVIRTLLTFLLELLLMPFKTQSFQFVQDFNLRCLGYKPGAHHGANGSGWNCCLCLTKHIYLQCRFRRSEHYLLSVLFTISICKYTIAYKELFIMEKKLRTLLF